MSVYYSDLIGSRESKYDYLNTNDVDTTEWIELDVCKPYHFFEPRNFSSQDDYSMFLSMSDIFGNRSTGVLTSRDALTIHKTRKNIWEVVTNFSKMNIDGARDIYKLVNDTPDWKVELAQKDIREHGIDNNLIRPILYRPFDIRHTYYTGQSKGFISSPKQNIMQHVLHENISILFCRQQSKVGFQHAFVSDGIISSGAVSNRGSEKTYVCPLYLYTNNTRTPNIDPNIITTLTTTYNTKPTPEDIFYYIYGILHSNTYRQKYAELLKIDFPKIPFTTNHDMFMAVGAIGKQLADIHLMKPEVFNHSTISYHGSGENRIDKVSYDESTQRVYINKTQYFDMIPPEVWNCQIGGYRPSKKWLDDRRHDVLTPDDIDHYRYIGHALERTMELQIEIDMIYDDIDKDVIIW